MENNQDQYRNLTQADAVYHARVANDLRGKYEALLIRTGRAEVNNENARIRIAKQTETILAQKKTIIELKNERDALRAMVPNDGDLEIAQAYTDESALACDSNILERPPLPVLVLDPFAVLTVPVNFDE